MTSQGCFAARGLSPVGRTSSHVATTSALISCGDVILVSRSYITSRYRQLDVIMKY